MVLRVACLLDLRQFATTRGSQVAIPHRDRRGHG